MSGKLRFDLLGPLRVWRDGEELDAGPVQQRVMLAVLLLNANRPVSRGKLIEAVWGAAAPGRAVNLLQRHAAGLRRVLEPGRPARAPSRLLNWTEAGYVLTVPPGGLDREVLTGQMERGRSARAAGDLRAAAEALHTALRMWRGRLCEGLASPLLDAERDRLEEHRLGVLEERIEVDLALGADTDLVGELRRLIAAHPLRERPHALLMRALHRSGRQAEALQAYRDAHRLLTEELGIEPGAELRRVHEQILAADTALDPPAPTPEVPAVLPPPEDRPEQGAAPRARGNLPTELTSFVGRQRELDGVRDLLAASRLVTLTGVGGVGKTRLGLRAALNHRPDFRDGVWLVELAGLSDPGLVAHAVAEALDVHVQTGGTPLASLVRHLRDREVLLVLDDCEHVLHACAVLVDALLKAATRLRVLATSRQPLAIDGEHFLPVAPLRVLPEAARGREDSAGTGAAPDEESAAVTLFAHRARAAVPCGFAMSPEIRATVTRICQRLDGIPLAIELAAGRLRTLSPEQLLARLDDRFRVLASARPTALPRHQTLQATVCWSFHLCTDDERLLWVRLSTFTDSFDLEAAEAVCAGDDLPTGEILDLVDGLVDKSVLIRERSAGGIRFRLLETLREYGRRQIRDGDRRIALRRRHRDHYLALAEQGEREWFGSGQAVWADRLRSEHANFREALGFSFATAGEGPAGARLAAALYFYWIACGYVEEAQRWLDRALRLTREPSGERAKALWVMSRIAYLRGDLAASVTRSAECREVAGRLGDDAAMAHGTHMAGAAALLRDEPGHARLLLEEALDHYSALGATDSMVIMAQAQLAMASVFLGEPDRAVELCRKARSTCAAHDERWTLSYVLYVQAFAESADGDRAVAARHARECLRMKRDFRDRLGAAMTVDLLGWIAAADGTDRRAALLLGAAAEQWTTIGVPWFGSAYWRAPHDEGVRRARESLGRTACDTALRQGAQLPSERAVAYALEECPPVAPPTPGAGTATPLESSRTAPATATAPPPAPARA
ncbi:BTAD domain-containing putative transcriptional regulator [Streptomyces sp. NPDC004111]|uniref:BTAD domain-containing putative transcriptional regulator n=1 Tax=Streptomyces sp. NPDC004111 TaxID=3364690 RepID=UPI0036CEF039